MKTIPAAFQAMLDSGTYTIGTALLIRRADGQLFGFTSCIKPLVLDLTPWAAHGFTEDAFEFDYRQGLDTSTFVTTASLAVDNMDITTLDDGSLFDRDDLLQGRWNNAHYWVFRYNWAASPVTIANDVVPMTWGQFGESKVGGPTLTIELRGPTQLLQQTVGEVTSVNCKNRLGDDRCGKDLAPFTHALTVTAVTDRGKFTCSAATQAADYFGNGTVTFNSGNNTGLSQTVRAFAGGVFELTRGMVMDIQVGDTLTAIAGCRGRRTEDCFTKFDNVLRMRAEPDTPGADELTKPGVPG